MRLRVPKAVSSLCSTLGMQVQEHTAPTVGRVPGYSSKQSSKNPSISNGQTGPRELMHAVLLQRT